MDKQRMKEIGDEYFRIALIAQLGERQTEDLKVTGSIPVQGKPFIIKYESSDR